MAAAGVLRRTVMSLWLGAPALWLMTFALMVNIATSMLGRLPRYGQPDPKSLEPIWLLTMVSQYALVAATVSPLVILIYALGRRVMREPFAIGRVALIAYLLSLAAAGLVLAANPLGLVSWFLD